MSGLLKQTLVSDVKRTFRQSTSRSLEEWVPRLHDHVLAWRGESSMERSLQRRRADQLLLHLHGEKLSEGGERFLVRPFFPVVALSGSEMDRIWPVVEQ
jgi:hypothetical protein